MNKDNNQLNNKDLNNIGNSKKIFEIKNDKKYKRNQINLDEKKNFNALTNNWTFKYKK